MSITFQNPWVLLLIPVIIAALIFSMRFMYSRNTAQKISRIIIRALVASLLVLALSGITFKIVGKDVTTIFLVDVSDSVRERKDEVTAFINDAIKTKGRHDYVGVIAFGGDTRVEQFISKDVSFSGLYTEVDSQATNLEDAVNMALAQMPEDCAKRIVLITDGNENEGNLNMTASAVIASGVDFEICRLEENVSDEVYVANVTVPQEVGVGENFSIQVEVESNVACPATVKLFSGRTLKGQQRVNLQVGTNQFIFKDTQTDEGLKTYRVVVEADKDTVTVNNEFSAYTNIETNLPLLVVEGEAGKGREMRSILDAIGKKYDVVTPGTVPSTMSDFLQYSAIIFIDVYKDDLKEGFLDNLEDYVKNYGGGFVATGGANSFALGGYRDTSLETVLPVYMDPKGENEVPSIAIEMVIDQSGSMEDGNGIINNLDLAKESAAAAVDNLRLDEDYVGVIAFSTTYDRVVPLEKVTDKDAVKDEIYSLAPGGGTSIYPAIAAAAADLSKNPAMVKHIILLTDGQDGNNEYSDLINTINGAGITLSCVSIGDGSNDALLTMLADACGGRYFHTDLNTDIPRIFAQEIYLSSDTYLINEDFVPATTSTDQIIRDVAGEDMPELHGYIATSVKERSIQALASPYGDPILAYWQYGLGKTVAWTSDVTGEWSEYYSGWDKTPLMWHNILQYVTEDNGMEGSYVTIEQKGSKAVIHYTTEEFDSKTKVVATVFDDEGNVKEITLDPTKPGEYQAEIDTKSTGVYSINVQQKDGEDIVSSINTAAIMQYSLEYRFYPNNTLLNDFSAVTGATFLESAADVFPNPPEFVKNRYSLTITLLLIAGILFLCDIAIRRFHVDVWHILGLDRVRAKINARAEKREYYRKNKESIKRAQTAREVASGIETASMSGAGSVPEDAEKAGKNGAEAESETGKEAAKSTSSKKKKKKKDDDAPKATTLFAEMNEKRSYENSQKQAAMQNAMKQAPGQSASYGPAPGQPLRQGTPMRASSAPMQQQRPVQQPRPMQQQRPPQQVYVRQPGAPMQNGYMPQRPQGPAQGGNWVNRVNPGNSYTQQGMNYGPRGGYPGQNPQGMPGNNQTRTWTRK
ncbi:MAG: VWA domain-containing protein [Lachnospiraceae bacterium]|nr:VWA domain-containing protein [Lachnospiraceae bacterium]